MKRIVTIFVLPILLVMFSWGCEKKDSNPNSKEIVLNFDEISETNNLGLTYIDKGISFENTKVLSHEFAISAPNMVQSFDFDYPITINFTDGTTSFEIQIDSDGFNSLERQPQVLAYNENGDLIKTVSFDQGPDIIKIKSQNSPIFKIKLGSYLISNPSVFVGSDGFDNLKYLY